MKNFFVLIGVLLLTACVAGEFTPERHAEYELGKPDCSQTPQRCIDGVPW